MSTQPAQRNRVAPGVPTGGQFAVGERGEAFVSLQQAKSQAEHAVDEAYAAGIAEGIRRARGEEPRDIDGTVLDLTDVDLALAERVTTDPTAEPGTVACLVCPGHGYGYQVGDGLYSGTCEGCGGSGTHAATPTGQDTVEVPGWGTFERSRDGVWPDTPYAIRLEADRPLSDDEVRQAAQLLGYKYASTVRGEPLGWPQRDSSHSFIVSADTTKSASDDLAMALDDFEDGFGAFMSEGSPVRKTDRAGAGTKGTRLVDGFGDPTLGFEIYYDSVITRG